MVHIIVCVVVVVGGKLALLGYLGAPTHPNSFTVVLCRESTSRRKSDTPHHVILFAALYVMKSGSSPAV
eukprot:1158788-Pelagomonas_calceolata.AAC.4